LGRENCQRENVRALVTSNITRTGVEYALLEELIDPQSGDTVRSHSEQSYGEGHILGALDLIAADIRRCRLLITDGQSSHPASVWGFPAD
jgi:hypothetical protein